mgnify:CR=1 FL=1
MFNSVISVFVSMNFFKQGGVFASLPDIFNVLGIILTMFLVPIFMKKIGKKEIVTAGLIFSSIITFAQIFIILMPRQASIVPYYLYVGSKFVSGVGVGFFNSLVWGMIADCSDDMQIKSGIREDGTTYAILMFSRKVGQCVAFILGQVILIVINYYTYIKAGETLPESSQNMLYLLATIISLSCYIAGALLLIFWYPINKNRLEEIQDAKELLLEKEAKKVETSAS